MAAEIVGKFKKGDKVVIRAQKSGTEEWCDGCHGVVKGIWAMGTKPIPDYLVHLDDSPSGYIRVVFVNENDLRAE